MRRTRAGGADRRGRHGAGRADQNLTDPPPGTGGAPPGRPAERAVLDAVPDSGKVLGPLLADVAHSAAVAELIEGLRRGGLVGQHSLAGHPHLSAAGRQARKELENCGAEARGDQRVAVLGSAGIADGALRDVFQSPDPPPGGKLVPRTRKGGYDEALSDPPIPMHPGIPGRW